MMPYDTYRLYQLERAKSPREIQCADRPTPGGHIGDQIADHIGGDARRVQVRG
jgi:hypothetical protein